MIEARWHDWNEIKDWERFKNNDNKIISEIYADKKENSDEFRDNQYYCIGINNDKKTIFCSAIDTSDNSGWDPSKLNRSVEGFKVDITTGNTPEEILYKGANKCLNLPYGDGYDFNSKTKGNPGILFGEGNCKNLVGYSIYDVNSYGDTYMKNSNNNKITKVPKILLLQKIKLKIILIILVLLNQ